MNSFQIQPPSFDLFEIFSEEILYDENTHSEIIAYFLGAIKNGHRFPYYKEILKALLAKYPMTFVLEDQMDFEKVDVTREAYVIEDQKKGRIDILVTIPVTDNNRKFALVIENKISSFEHGQQLQTYYKHAVHLYHNKPLFILLSPKNITSSHPNYEFLSYKELAQIIQNITSDDKHIQAFIDLYCLCLNQVSEHIPAKFQDYLAASIKHTISKDDSGLIGKVGSYNNTWIDFEPAGWDEIISSRWNNPLPDDGIWGMSFHFSQVKGLSLEFYFLEQFGSFYEPFYQQNKDLLYFQKPERVGQGSNIWMSIYSRQIIGRNKLDQLEKAYLKSDTSEALAEAESIIVTAWQQCISEFAYIHNRLKEFI